MNQELRAIFNTTDISADVNDYRSGTASFAYTSGQYLYIGSVLPFNNLWFEPGTVNAVAATVSISIWYANAWTAAVDVIDGTLASGKSLAQAGRIQFRPDENKGWDIEQYSRNVTGLPSTSRIYNMYWARFAWSDTLTAGTTLKYIGQKFSTDTQLYSYYPDLDDSTLRSSFASGKTTWDEQHYMAGEQIVRQLRQKGIIKSRSQLLDASLLVEASCHRVAMIVYTAMGQPYFDQLEQAKKDYSAALNMDFFSVDQNNNGDLEPVERTISTTFGTR